MNNRGFAVTTVVYSILILLSLFMFLILSTLRNEYANQKEFSNDINSELNNDLNRDKVAPKISGIEINGCNNNSCVTGDVITMVVTYDEKVVGEAPTMQITIGGQVPTNPNLSGTINDAKVTYNYTVSEEDSGVFKIESLTGNLLTDIAENKADNTITVTIPTITIV